MMRADISRGIRSSKHQDPRAALKGPIHLGVGVASAMVGVPAFAQQAATPTELELPTVQVQDATGGFYSDNTGVTRLPVPIFDMPQQVNVVTEQVLREQNDTTLEQALRQRVGHHLQRGRGRHAGRCPHHSRLLRARRHVPGRHPRYRLVHARHVQHRQVDVFMGPASFAFGARFHRRRHQHGVQAAKNATSWKATSPAIRRAAGAAPLDANGKVNDNLFGRINIMGQNVDTADRNNVNSERWGIAPSVTFNINDKTSVTATITISMKAACRITVCPICPRRP